MKEKEIRLECLKLAAGDMVKAQQFLKFVHDVNTVPYTFPDTTKAWKPAYKYQDYKLSISWDEKEADRLKNQNPKIQEYWENSI
tara:strand:+ start:2347 stop:2598 length:252 start_codon:yes stop_codon:yes gene_type:complete